MAIHHFIENNIAINLEIRKEEAVGTELGLDDLRDDKVEIMKAMQVSQYLGRKDGKFDFLYVGHPDEYELS